MPARTTIEWADYSSNPIKFEVDGKRCNLCVPISNGCRNCYAAAITKRFSGVEYKREVIDMAKVVLDQKEIEHMLKFKPKAQMTTYPTFKNGRTRPVVFVEDMSDLFGDWVSFEMIDKLFAVFALRPDVDWLLLTKRPKRMMEYLSGDDVRSRIWTTYRVNWLRGICGADKAPEDFPAWPLPNVWLGTSVENQRAADERIPHLLKCPAAVRFLSCEPLLGAVDINLAIKRGLPDWYHCVECQWLGDDVREFDDTDDDREAWPICPNCESHDTGGHPSVGNLDVVPSEFLQMNLIDWVICGGESGPKARPMHPDWARSLRDQCAGAGVPFYFKQWGEFECSHAPTDKPYNLNRSVWLTRDGEMWGYRHNLSHIEAERRGLVLMRRVGKKNAGRLLDRNEHNDVPGGKL